MEVVFDIGREIIGVFVYVVGKFVLEIVIYVVMVDIWMFVGVEVVDGVSDGKFLYILCNGIFMLMVYILFIFDV